MSIKKNIIVPLFSCIALLFSALHASAEKMVIENHFHLHLPGGVINLTAKGGSNTNFSSQDMESLLEAHTKHKGGGGGGGNASSNNQANQNSLPKPSASPSSFFKKLGFKQMLILAAGAVTCVYLSHTFVMYKTNQVLKRKRSWCNWKRECTFEELVQQQPKALSQELLTVIQERHHNPHNPADHVYPVTQFLYEVAYESAVLTAYLRLTKWEQRFQLSRFFSQRDLTPIVMQRLDRLAYLKSLFFDWAREHRARRSTHKI